MPAWPNVPRAVLNLAGARLRHAERHWRSATRFAGRLGRKVQRQREMLAHAR
jgi:hypothetical protein